MTAEELRSLLLRFIGSLTLADHMGDVSDDISFVLKALGIRGEWDDMHDLGVMLGKMGVTTLYGTELTDEP